MNSTKHNREKQNQRNLTELMETHKEQKENKTLTKLDETIYIKLIQIALNLTLKQDADTNTRKPNGTILKVKRNKTQAEPSKGAEL